ncbi:MAG: N-6 DNA methylase [Alphaproteobacteria bacterium]|jgi:hypothetical protein|nr:N-6 DNA methylase [Alphaproteobacteria bacterium]
MAETLNRDPDLEWLDHVSPTGLVLSPTVIKEHALVPAHQTQADSAAAAEHLDPDPERPALPDPWAFVRDVLGWDARFVAGAPGGPPLPESLSRSVPEHETVLAPDWAVQGFGEDAPWQLLVKRVAPGIDPDARGAAEGWEATPHQRFERLLRETGVLAGLMIADRELRLVYAPRGETSGWLSMPLRALGTVAGRPMLGGLKLVLDDFQLFSAPTERRLKALLKESRETQAAVSEALAGQVLGALHELLRGVAAAEPALVGRLTREQPQHLYEGLLTVLLRLVFVLYAEDRALLPSATDARSRELYENGYSLRGLYARLEEDAALNPDTMDERHGAWGRLLALFRLIHGGHVSGFVHPRGGKLFDPDVFPFLEGRETAADPPRVARLGDGCLRRVLEGLMTVREPKTKVRQRLSYRTLDVEQIGSVYETVMGFTVMPAPGRMLAIRAGKHNHTPVFADLDRLAGMKPADRAKSLREDSHRTGTLGKTVDTPLRAARSVADIAAALDPLIDERGAPNGTPLAAGQPMLQPTDERRRTGSHYTPRSLTEPIVRHALAPALDRLGPEATPEAVLDLKVCDPAMGSGAFLVEACRQLGERLVAAWARHPATRPAIPADEDEELHARRLVAQRCLYGVDRNPMAVDLARLSLWLATLARDHEFTFLDHALKSGDSLVGLSREQIAALHWDPSQPTLPLFRQLVTGRVGEALHLRNAIREAPDDVARAIQEDLFRRAETRLDDARRVGDGVIAAFFAADKPRARETRRAELEMWAGGQSRDFWDKLDGLVATLGQGTFPVRPFHWPLEFPEVFDRPDPGFDAIIGNPPFAGKNTLLNSNRSGYLDWLKAIHEGAHGNADLVAHFFRRAFALIRPGAAFGLIATNTIGQGDTRQTGLAAILKSGGAIARAVRRKKWPGEAAVVVSIVHVARGPVAQPELDGRPVSRVSAFLVEGDRDDAPAPLAANQGKAFIGSYVLGMGFTFDDVAAAKGTASSLADMQRLIDKDPRNAERIFPYIGGEEVNNDPRQQHHRYVIDFEDFPLRRDAQTVQSTPIPEGGRQRLLDEGVVPFSYPHAVAEDWTDLLKIVEEKVKPFRDKDARLARRIRWWRFGDRQPGLSKSIRKIDKVIVCSRVSPHTAFVLFDGGAVYAETLVVFCLNSMQRFASLQSKLHEIWARFFSSSMKDDLRYTPSDCFVTFPFQNGFENDPSLEAVGQAYHDFRAQLMIDRNEGLTRTYNRFHNRKEKSADIVRLRDLHTEMDHAVLRAYGWDDLVDRAVPVFLDEESEPEYAYQNRLFWRAEVRDEVLARLLALNAERHAEDVRRGLATPDGRLLRQTTPENTDDDDEDPDDTGSDDPAGEEDA